MLEKWSQAYLLFFTRCVCYLLPEDCQRQPQKKRVQQQDDCFGASDVTGLTWHLASNAPKLPNLRSNPRCLTVQGLATPNSLGRNVLINCPICIFVKFAVHKNRGTFQRIGLYLQVTLDAPNKKIALPRYLLWIAVATHLPGQFRWFLQYWEPNYPLDSCAGITNLMKYYFPAKFM